MRAENRAVYLIPLLDLSTSDQLTFYFPRWELWPVAGGFVISVRAVVKHRFGLDT